MWNCRLKVFLSSGLFSCDLLLLPYSQPPPHTGNQVTQCYHSPVLVFLISLLLHLWTFCSYVFSRSVMSDSSQPFWTVSHQAPVSMGFLRQECWSGLPFPPSGDLPYSWFKLVSPISPALQADSLPTEPLGKALNFLLRSNETGSLTFPTSSSPLAFRLSHLGLLAWSSGILVYFLFYFASL